MVLWALDLDYPEEATMKMVNQFPNQTKPAIKSQISDRRPSYYDQDIGYHHSGGGYGGRRPSYGPSHNYPIDYDDRYPGPSGGDQGVGGFKVCKFVFGYVIQDFDLNIAFRCPQSKKYCFH